MTDIKIEAGKYYRTRSGEKVGPMQVPPVGRWSDAVEASCDDRGWYKGGVYWRDARHDNDLIAEWRDDPDLTAITTPYGLLDRETQEALKAHGGPWEHWDGGDEWVETVRPAWQCFSVYRVKPAPPKPRETWAEFDEKGRLFATHDSKPVFLIKGHRLLKVADIIE